MIVRNIAIALFVSAFAFACGGSQSSAEAPDENAPLEEQIGHDLKKTGEDFEEKSTEEANAAGEAADDFIRDPADPPEKTTDEKADEDTE